ncbi:MAG: protein phosphatase 2C domain-containing protein [Myxococcota bacterium]
MNYSGIGLTDVGRRRSRNEDSLLVDDQLGLYVVADGIGGYAAGDVASRLAIHTVVRDIEQRSDDIAAIRRGVGTEAELSSIAAAAVSRASRVVYETGQADGALSGMGCTLTVLLMGQSSAAMAHVGDSRLYLARSGRIRQLSTDHSMAQELADLGFISPTDIAKLNCGHVLTRSIGRQEQVTVQELLIDTKPGDRFILCTDGLSNYLEGPDELSMVLADSTFATSAQCLIDFANTAGGSDNVTAVLVGIACSDDLPDLANAPALRGHAMTTEQLPVLELAAI